jgi:hypothetical protein
MMALMSPNVKGNNVTLDTLYHLCDDVMIVERYTYSNILCYWSTIVQTLFFCTIVTLCFICRDHQVISGRATFL